MAFDAVAVSVSKGLFSSNVCSAEGCGADFPAGDTSCRFAVDAFAVGCFPGGGFRAATAADFTAGLARLPVIDAPQNGQSATPSSKTD
jgi:hypothetical protein